MDIRGKYTDPQLPIEYAWIREGVPAHAHSVIGEPPTLTLTGLIAKVPRFADGEWCALFVGEKGTGFWPCASLSPAGEVEAVVWCQDLELAPFDVAIVFTLATPDAGMIGNEVLSGRRRGDSSWASVNQFGESAIHAAEEIHNWAFPLQGPRS